MDRRSVGGTATALALAPVGLNMVDPDRRDDVWARLCILDLRRQEAEQPGPIGIPLETPDRLPAARLLWDDPRFRYDLVWAVFESREQVLAEASDEPAPLTFWAGAYRRALPRWRTQAEDAEHRGAVARAVHAWSGVARCAAALGAFADAEQALAGARLLARRVDLQGAFALHLILARYELALAVDDGWGEVLTWLEEWKARSEVPERWVDAANMASIACINALHGQTESLGDVVGSLIEPVRQTPARFLGATRASGDLVHAVWLAGRTDHLARIEQIVGDKLVRPDFRSPLVDPRVALARTAALDGRADDAAASFASARAVLDEDGIRPLRALVDLDEAIMYARAGQADEARHLLAHAVPQLAELGMVGWLRRAERLDVSLG